MKRIKAGKYQTLDGKFDIILDPNPDWTYGTGANRKVPRVWLIFALGDDEPFFIRQNRAWASLGEAKQVLAEHLAEPVTLETRLRAVLRVLSDRQRKLVSALSQAPTYDPPSQQALDVLISVDVARQGRPGEACLTELGQAVAKHIRG